MKKAWVLYPLPFSHSEAFALPIVVRTSNAEAHADMNIQTISAWKHADTVRIIHIPRTSTIAVFLTTIKGSCEVPECQEQDVK